MESVSIIKKNEFPIHAKSLGTPLLAYTLGLSENTLERLFLEGGEVTSTQFSAIIQLDQIMLQVKQGRISNQVLEWGDKIHLPNIRFKDGSRPFNAIRQNIIGSMQQKSWNDPVMNILGRLCLECYPFCLLPLSNDSFPRVHFPHFYGEPIATEFYSAVLNDPMLSKLFNKIGENEIDTSGEYYTSLGNGGGIQLAVLPDSLLQSANALMRLHGEVTLDAFQNSMEQILSILRGAINGDPVQVPIAYCFDGVGFPLNTVIEFEQGKLIDIPKTILDILPANGKPSIHNDQHYLGCIYIAEVDFKIHIVQADGEKPSFNDTWPIDIADQLQDKSILGKISLITALAIEHPSPVSARQLSSLIINPLNYSGGGWQDRNYSLRDHLIASDEQIESLVYWTKLIEKTDAEQIGVAIRRYLSAIIERSDPADSLVDAVIGLENLFGERNEIAFTVASCVSILLEPEIEQREKAFSDVKKIYDARSKIVHGSTRTLGKIDIPSLRNLAILYLSSCLRVLFKERVELIQMTPAERVKAIILNP